MLLEQLGQVGPVQIRFDESSALLPPAQLGERVRLILAGLDLALERANWYLEFQITNGAITKGFAAELWQKAQHSAEIFRHYWDLRLTGNTRKKAEGMLSERFPKPGLNGKTRYYCFKWETGSLPPQIDRIDPELMGPSGASVRLPLGPDLNQAFLLGCFFGKYSAGRVNHVRSQLAKRVGKASGLAAGLNSVLTFHLKDEKDAADICNCAKALGIRTTKSIVKLRNIDYEHVYVASAHLARHFLRLSSFGCRIPLWHPCLSTADARKQFLRGFFVTAGGSSVGKDGFEVCKKNARTLLGGVALLLSERGVLPAVCTGKKTALTTLTIPPKEFEAGMKEIIPSISAAAFASPDSGQRKYTEAEYLLYKKVTDSLKPEERRAHGAAGRIQKQLKESHGVDIPDYVVRGWLNGIRPDSVTKKRNIQTKFGSLERHPDCGPITLSEASYSPRTMFQIARDRLGNYVKLSDVIGIREMRLQQIFLGEVAASWPETRRLAGVLSGKIAEREIFEAVWGFEAAQVLKKAGLPLPARLLSCSILRHFECYDGFIQALRCENVSVGMFERNYRALCNGEAIDDKEMNQILTVIPDSEKRKVFIAFMNQGTKYVNMLALEGLIVAVALADLEEPVADIRALQKISEAWKAKNLRDNISELLKLRSKNGILEIVHMLSGYSADEFPSNMQEMDSIRESFNITSPADYGLWSLTPTLSHIRGWLAFEGCSCLRSQYGSSLCLCAMDAYQNKRNPRQAVINRILDLDNRAKRLQRRGNSSVALNTASFHGDLAQVKVEEILDMR